MGKLIYIPKYKLVELYKGQKFSVRKIAKIYNCDGRTIHRKLKVFGIKTRSPSEAATKVNIPKGKLRYHYIHKKLSTCKIAKIYNCDDFTIFKKLRTYGIKIRTKSEAISRYHRYNFKGNLREKAYMIGFRLGDLYVERNHHLMIVKCSSTYLEQIGLIKNLFNKYGHIRIRKTIRLSGKRNIIDICCHLNKSFEFLLPKKDIIPKWIRQNKIFFISFLAGYTDAEGWIGISGKKKHLGFQIKTYDKNILYQIWLVLQRLKIIFPRPRIVQSKTKRPKQRKDYWGISVNKKESILKLLYLLQPYMKYLKKRKIIRKIILINQ
ncbi:MAG: LAGLIDADG family homing endonuclease [Candidatus Nealsonbacteria bacterium]